MKKKYLKLLLLLIASFILERASAQLLLTQPDSISFGQMATKKDSLLFTQIKTRHLLGVELLGAGGFASVNYSYFRDNVMYQIGLGVIPAIDRFKEENSWLIPIQIQFQNPNYCECSQINYDFGFWGRVDLSQHNSEVYNQYHAVGVSLKLKNYLKNNKDWIVQFGIYPHYDLNQRKFMTTLGLQISK